LLLAAVASTRTCSLAESICGGYAFCQSNERIWPAKTARRLGFVPIYHEDVPQDLNLTCPHERCYESTLPV
jgi:hypothetical protein